MASFDLGAARRFIGQKGTQLERLRLSHFQCESSDEMLWKALGPYQNRDGGWAYGLDLDYRGAESSILTTIAALRIICMHGLGSHKRLEDTYSFLSKQVLSDGTWRERAEVQSFSPPPWYRPSTFRVWESGCLAGYGAVLGERRAVMGAAAYIRSIWREMPVGSQLQPYIATLLLFGPSKQMQDRSMVEVALRGAESLFQRTNPDPLDSVWLMEAMLIGGLRSAPTFSMFADWVAKHQQADGGIVTTYGKYLRGEATLNAYRVFSALQ